MKLINDLPQLVKYLPVFYYHELNWSLVIIFGILPLLSGDRGGREGGGETCETGGNEDMAVI